MASSVMAALVDLRHQLKMGKTLSPDALQNVLALSIATGPTPDSAPLLREVLSQRLHGPRVDALGVFLADDVIRGVAQRRRAEIGGAMAKAMYPALGGPAVLPPTPDSPCATGLEDPLVLEASLAASLGAHDVLHGTVAAVVCRVDELRRRVGLLQPLVDGADRHRDGLQDSIERNAQRQNDVVKRCDTETNVLVNARAVLLEKLQAVDVQIQQSRDHRAKVAERCAVVTAGLKQHLSNIAAARSVIVAEVDALQRAAAWVSGVALFDASRLVSNASEHILRAHRATEPLHRVNAASRSELHAAPHRRAYKVCYNRIVVIIKDTLRVQAETDAVLRFAEDNGGVSRSEFEGRKKDLARLRAEVEEIHVVYKQSALTGDSFSGPPRSPTSERATPMSQSDPTMSMDGTPRSASIRREISSATTMSFDTFAESQSLAGCESTGNDQGEVERYRCEMTSPILCFGDSLTAGYPCATPYALSMAATLGVPFVASPMDLIAGARRAGAPPVGCTLAALSGYRAKELVALADTLLIQSTKFRGETSGGLRALLAAHDYHAVVVMAGTNDLADTDSVDEILTDLRALHRMVVDRGALAVVLPIPESKFVLHMESKNAQRMAINAALRTDAEGSGGTIVFLDVNSVVPYDGESGRWHYDGLHMTPKGYEAVGVFVGTQIKAMLTKE